MVDRQDSKKSYLGVRKFNLSWSFNYRSTPPKGYLIDLNFNLATSLHQFIERQCIAYHNRISKHVRVVKSKSFSRFSYRHNPKMTSRSECIVNDFPVSVFLGEEKGLVLRHSSGYCSI
jgi:hypothetical protein